MKIIQLKRIHNFVVHDFFVPSYFLGKIIITSFITSFVDLKIILIIYAGWFHIKML
jgi:hypothetical protein